MRYLCHADLSEIASASVSANGKSISAQVDFLRNPLFPPSTAFKELAVSPITLHIEFGKRDKPQCGGVDAISQPALIEWTIVEDMAEMAVTMR
jgi:hypothetical protein